MLEGLVIGSKSPTQTSSSSVTTPSPEALAADNTALSKAQAAATTPYQAYSGELTAGVNGQESNAINATNSLGSTTSGYLNTASGLAGASTAAVNPTALDGAAIQQYMSPYQSQVIAATQAQMAQQDAVQNQQQTSQAIGAGSFGGDRAGVAQAALAGQQALANNSTLANLNNTNYSQALTTAQGQQSLGLAADQSNRSALATGAQLQAGLGSTASSTGIANANAQLQGGLLQQQTAQAGDTANYGQFEQAQAFPFQESNFLTSATAAIAPSMGTTTNGTQQQAAPSIFNSLVGGGLGLASIFSDERLKENIRPVGKTYDGQTLYSYNYKGEPATRVGLIAQEVEQKHPHAVTKTLGDLRMVDYDKATRASADKGHFARGGRTLGDVMPVRRYASGGLAGAAMTAMPFGDATGYIPTASLAAARAPQSGGGMGGSSSGLAGAAQSNSFNMNSPIAQGAKLFAGSSAGDGLHDTVQDWAQDNLGLARGGKVLSLADARIKRGFDSGGTVSPDAMMFDPDALNDPTASFMQPGLLGAALPNTLQPSNSGLAGAALPPAPSSVPAPAAPAPVQDTAPVMAPAPNARAYTGGDGQGLGAAGVTQPSGLAGAALPPSTDAAPATGLAGAAINTASPPSGQVGSNFDRSVNRTLGFEGGMNPSDANGTPSNFGINQAAHPDLDVSKLTSDQAKGIYKSQYWDAIGADSLPAPLAHVAFDTSVIAGPGKAKELLAQSGGDPNKFMDLRDAYLNGLVAKDPDKYGPYAKAWAARDAGLRSDINGGTMPSTAMAYSGDSAGTDPVQTGRSASTGLAGAAQSPQSLSDYFGSAIGGTGVASAGHSGGLLGLFPGVSDDARMGLLSAAMGIMGSGSRNVGMAIGQGAQQGIKTYQDTQKLNNEVALGRAKIANIGSEISDRPVGRDIEKSKVTLAAQELQARLKEISLMGDRTKSENDARTVDNYNKTHQFKPQGMVTTDPLNNPSVSPKIVPYTSMQQVDSSGKPLPLTDPPPQSAASPGVATGYVPPPAKIPINTMQFSPEGTASDLENTRSMMDTARAGYTSSQGVKMSLDQMDHAVAALPATGWAAAGPGQQERASAGKALNQVLTTLGVSPENLPNASAYGATEELKKLSFRMGADLSKSIGGKEPGFIVQQSVGAVPSSDNTATGYRRIVGGLRAVAQRQDDYYRYLSDWQQKAGGSTSGADVQFNKDNPPEKYVGMAITSTLPQQAMDALRQRPDMRPQFDAKYGAGTSKYVLRQ